VSAHNVAPAIASRPSGDAYAMARPRCASLNSHDRRRRSGPGHRQRPQPESVAPVAGCRHHRRRRCIPQTRRRRTHVCTPLRDL